MDIGRPKRIIDVEPVSVPLPETISMPAVPETTGEPLPEPTSTEARSA